MLIDPPPFDLSVGSGTFTADLDASTRGAVHSPTDPGFADATAGFDRAVDHRPDAVLVAADAADVVEAVRAAARHGRRVAVQATGHGAAATVPGTVLISVRRLDQLHVDADARTATVGAGVVWQQVLDAAAVHGLAGLSGSAPGVGVIGYTLGGGMGPVARTFGFASDLIVSLDLVTGDGELITVSPDSDPELFSALCGGGGAFGIVTAMTFRLIELRSLYAGGVFFGIDVARTVIRSWAEWTPSLPDSVSTSIARVNLPPDPALPPVLRDRAVVHLRYAHVGDPQRGADLLAPLLRSTAPPLLTHLDEIPYAALGSIHADPTSPMPVTQRGVLLRELSPAAIERFVDITSPAAGLPLANTEIRLLGGALDRAPRLDGVAGRAAGSYHLHAVAAPGTAQPGRVAAVDAVCAALDPWATGQVLHNFAGTETARGRDALRRTLGPTAHTRLTAVRNRTDPHRRFAPMSRW